MFYTNYENEEQELLRRLGDIDSWSNKNNVDQAKDDVEFILNDIDQQMKLLEEMISKYEVRKKKLLKFGNFFAGVFSGSIGYYITTMILGVHFSPAIYFLLFGVMAASLITAWICFAKTVPTKEMYRLSDKIKEGRKFATLYTWWYEALRQSYIKGVYKRVYSDTFKIVDEACQDKEIRRKIEEIKIASKITFNYLGEELR